MTIDFKKLTKIAATLTILTFATSCASTLNVRSEPSGANVSLREMGSNEEKSLGTTPLTLSSKEIDLNSKAGPFVVKVQHPEFGEKTAFVTRLDGQDIELFLTLDSEKNGTMQAAELNSFIDELFRAQGLANQKDFAGASALLNKLAEKHPRIAAIYELRGSVSILKNDVASALRDYNMAVTLNPSSLEALRIQKELQAVNGARQPSSEVSGRKK